MKKEVKKFGVDIVKKVIKLIYDSTIEGIDVLKDKKISLGEILNFSDNLYAAIILALKADDLWQQIRDIDADEGLEIANYIGELIKGATPEDIDLIIENSIQIVEKELAIYKENIKPMIDIFKR
jgi:hypothetical protein